MTAEMLERLAELMRSLQKAEQQLDMFLNGTVDVIDQDQTVLAKIDLLGNQEHELKVVT
jgi:hypothetical protein